MMKSLSLDGQQAGLNKSGNKLPHSKALRAYAKIRRKHAIQ
jgi:hypothetical protein